MHALTKWQLKEPVDTQKLNHLLKTTTYSAPFLKLCLQRGLDTAEKIETFIQPDFSELHDPLLMHDMEKATIRIKEAVTAGEKITIYGDYDADGITSVSVLLETLLSIGAEVDYYIPHRQRDGYGPNPAAFDRLIDDGTQLLITVDNGVAGHKGIERAAERGVDVIVTDHHEIPSTLPQAYAIVHPAHTDGQYPFADLAGVGVAFKLAWALLEELPTELLDLVAIGTVADLVPLRAENRTLVMMGLKHIRQTTRPGLLALLKVIGQEADRADEQLIGFQIAPRLNATGRIDEATLGVELLTTFDDQVATELAERIDALNNQRKEMVKELKREALAVWEDEPLTASGVVLKDKNWHEGILGIVAGQLAEVTKKPTIIFSEDQRSGVLKGSARSVAGFNIYEALSTIEELLVAFGGHEMAAGLTVKAENYQTFKEQFLEIVNNANIEEQPLLADEALKLSEIDLEFLDEVSLLKPFGVAHEEPQYVIEDSTLQELRVIGADRSHLKFQLVDNADHTLDVIAFNYAKDEKALLENHSLSVLGTLSINEWNGRRQPQLMLQDFAVEGPLLYDFRTNVLSDKMFTEKEFTYIVSSEELYQFLKERYPERTWEHLPSVKKAAAYQATGALALVDCPPSIKWFMNLMQGNNDQLMYLYFYKKHQHYLTGLPTREEAGRLYKWLHQQQSIQVPKDLQTTGKRLGIDYQRLIIIITMFLEAKLVKIVDHQLTVTPNPAVADLASTITYRRVAAEIEAEELFLYNSFGQLKKEISSWDLT